MTRIALISALHDELSAVLARMPDEHRTQVAGRQFGIGHWHGHEVVAGLSGIGKVAAATTATLLIERFGVRQIIFTGVAGGLGPGVRVGDVVVARGLLQHDMNASPLFPRHEVPGYGRSTFDADAGLTDRLAAAVQSTLGHLPQVLAPGVVAEFGLHQPRLHQGLLLSGDQFVGTTAASQALQARLPEALAVEMEGAAFAQVCHDYGVPLAVMRTISDRADDTAHVDFMRFLRAVASRYSVDVLERFFAAL